MQYIYFKPISRSALAHSFVDNIAISAQQQLAMAFSFLALWGLDLDMGKTYTWGTSPEVDRWGCQRCQTLENSEAPCRIRKAIAIGFCCNEGPPEIGCSTATPVDHAARSLLARSPPWGKRMPVSGTFLTGLRTQAVKAPKVKHGGASQVLRLTFLQPMTADPGYYLLRRTIHDLRRISHKTPELLASWGTCMGATPGEEIAGPFSKLLQTFTALSWTMLQPPFFLDHDNVLFNLMELNNHALESILEDACVQQSIRIAGHRKSLADVGRVDRELSLSGWRTLTPLQASQYMCICEGAFISDWQHAKFDLAKCQVCQEPDTQMHWLQCQVRRSQGISS